MHKYELPLNGISDKLRSLIDSPTFKIITEIQKRQDAMNRFMYPDSQFKESLLAIDNMNREMTEKASAIANMNRDIIEKTSSFLNMHKDLFERTMLTANEHKKIIEDSMAASTKYESLIKESVNSIADQNALINEAMLAATDMSSMNRAYEEMQNLYKNIALTDKHYYQSLTISDVFNQFYSASWEAMNIFLQNTEINEYYSEEDITEIRSFVDRIKDFVKQRELISPEKLSLLGFLVTSVLIQIHTVVEGINSGQIDQNWGTIAIINLYFFIAYSIFLLMKKDE